MNKALLKNILIVLLLTIAVFSGFKYTSSLKEKYDLLNKLHRLEQQMASLEKEKLNLLQEVEKEKELQLKLTQQHSELKALLRAGRIRLMKLFRGARKTEEEFQQLNSQISILKLENKSWIEKDDNLKLQFSQIREENEALKLRLNSLAELKKAIRELKQKMRKVNLGKEEKPQEVKIIEGNHGFIIKDRLYTYPAKVKIEVIPANNLIPVLKKE